MSKPFIFERCQFGDSPTEFNKADGEAGYGLYAYVPNSNMRAYYSSRGENCYRLKQSSGTIIDLTHGPLLVQLLEFAENTVKKLAHTMPGYIKPRISKQNIQRFGMIITDFIRKNYPDATAYIVNHEGPGLPKGKQAVILDVNAFSISSISIKDVELTNETSLNITCAVDDLKNVSEWLGCDINELNLEIEMVPIEKFRNTIIENISTYDEFPKDRQRTEKIIAALQRGEQPFPIFVEKTDPHLFVMEGRHRIVAFEAMEMKTVPVAFVSKAKIELTIPAAPNRKISP